MDMLKTLKPSSLRKRRKRNSRPKQWPLSVRRPLFEALEPRILLSHDPFYAATAAFDMSLRLENDNGIETLKLIDNELGEVAASKALSDIIDVVEIAGSDFDDILRIEIDPSIISTNILNGIIFDAGIGNDTLQGPNSHSTWNITGNDAGNVGGAGVMDFTGIENLKGGSGRDNFVFGNNGNNNVYISGTIEGGGDTDTLDYSAYTSDVTVDLASGASTGTGGISDFQNIIGGTGTDTLIGLDADNVWTITGDDAGTVGSVTFIGIESLTGGAGDDTFVFELGGSLGGVIDGGLGDDTLVGADMENTWIIDDIDAGFLNGQAFVNIENLVGGAEADLFVFNGGSVSGKIDGGGGVNTLDYSAYASDVIINMASGGVSDFQNIIGGTGADTLIGLDTDSIWTVTGNDSGTVGN